MKRVGLMGCGVIATYGHLPAINETPGLDLAAIYDPNPEQLNRLGNAYPGAKRFTDSEAFFRDGNFDGVAITSPAPFHLSNAQQAASFGKHILCEKPLAMTDADIETMIRAADSAGVMLSAAFCYRFSPVALKIKELIAQKRIGEVRALRLIYIWNLHGKYEYLPDGSRIESPLRVGRMEEGGPMVDCGVHQIDLARWWMNAEVVRQQSSGAWIDNNYAAPEHMWLHMDHENGAHTAVEMSFSYTHTASEPIDNFSYHIIGTEGLIRYDRLHWQFEVRTPYGTEYLPGASEKNFAGMYAAWRDALHSGQPGDLPTGRDGLLVTRIARAATDQVIANREVLNALTTKV